MNNFEELLIILEKRFIENMHRHLDINWKDILDKLDEDKLSILKQMEDSGGEPDVVSLDNNTYVYCDCSKESPDGRRSLCYDQLALDKRKQNKPAGNVCSLAEIIGIELLDEQEYYALQELEPFDLKTSSWIKTPERIRQLGGALFCENRYQQVFTYHNGADSYYGARSFRGKLKI